MIEVRQKAFGFHHNTNFRCLKLQDEINTLSLPYCFIFGDVFCSGRTMICKTVLLIEMMGQWRLEVMVGQFVNAKNCVCSIFMKKELIFITVELMLQAVCY